MTSMHNAIYYYIYYITPRAWEVRFWGWSRATELLRGIPFFVARFDQNWPLASYVLPAPQVPATSGQHTPDRRPVEPLYAVHGHYWYEK
jgi:hypothetical protein